MLSLHFQWDIHTSAFSQSFLVFPTINSKSFEGKEPELFLSLHSSVKNDAIQSFTQLT